MASKVRRAAALAAALLLLFLSSGAGSRLLIRSLEAQSQPLGLASEPGAPAIVVLGVGLAGAGIEPTNETRGAPAPPQLGSHVDRLWKAAELYKAGKAPLILVSGGGPAKEIPESSLAARILQAWDIPAAAILTEQASRDTHQNAVFTRRILLGKGIRRILLVTSALHMPRAAATFRRTGLTVIPVPADFLAGGPPDDLLPSLIPGPAALADSRSALKEWLGLAVYRLRDWAL